MRFMKVLVFGVLNVDSTCFFLGLDVFSWCVLLLRWREALILDLKISSQSLNSSHYGMIRPGCYIINRRVMHMYHEWFDL